MTDKVFVDTNILVHARDAADPVKQGKAHALLSDLWKDRNGRLSVQVCNDYFVTVTRKLKPGLDEAAAWEDLEMYAAWTPLPMDFKVLLKAREAQLQYGLSWWDSLIIASACISECALIVSEDLNAGQSYFGLPVINPFLTDVPG